MSLTDFVEDPDIRDHINDVFPNQGDRASKPLEADWQTSNYALVGTAFDYLLRFWLQRQADTVETRPWIAENGLQKAHEIHSDYTGEIEETIRDAKQLRDEFVETGELTRPLVEAAIDLARIDAIYRGGHKPRALGEYATGDVVDCLYLMEILEESDAYEDTSHAVLNPAFGLASSLVNGADADVIADGTLVDVKTTSKPTFKASYWRQLVGYLVLADLHDSFHTNGVYESSPLELGPDAQPLPEITDIGVYFARHGELTTISADEIYEDESYPEFRSWFTTTALSKYDMFDDPLRTLIQHASASN